MSFALLQVPIIISIYSSRTSRVHKSKMVIKNISTILFLGFLSFKVSGWSVPGETLGTSKNFDSFDCLFNNCPAEGRYSTKFHTRRLRPEVQPLSFYMPFLIDYEQSLFFLDPSSKTRETRKWPRPRFSRACTLLLNLKKKRVSSQSTFLLPLTNGTPFQLPSLELCSLFNCCKCTVFLKNMNNSHNLKIFTTSSQP